VDSQAAALAGSKQFAPALTEKAARRARDEGLRPLADYRAEELARMRMNFYGFDPSYHIARHRFVHRTPHAWTPLHLARHRRLEVADRAQPARV
jgi:putative two-component system hydrogenase maturation factor HypX/HoxX